MARDQLAALKVRATQCNLIDESGWTNQAVPFTRTLQHMIVQAEAIVGGAIERQESRGAHFKMDTPERDDEKWLCTTKCSFTPSGPKYDFSEKIECSYLAPRARKYKINQIKVVNLVMGERYLETGVAESKMGMPLPPA